jgi:uncharacterized membrane protein
MRNINFYRKIGVVLLSFLLLAVLWIATITHTNRNLSNPNPLIHFAIQNNFVILIVLIVVSVAYGFLWSSLSYFEINRKKKDSEAILKTVFLFLSNDEKNMIEFLVQNDGQTTQAELSRLPGMNRVKAFRLLQKMQGKNLVEIIPHGKVRRIRIKENIMNTLRENIA